MKIRLNNKVIIPVQINKEVYHGCPVPPTIFNTYINKIISGRNTCNIKRIKITRSKLCKEPYFCRWSCNKSRIYTFS
jgi:hypothetical protein